MALVFNTADGTTRREHWFHSFDISSSIGTVPQFPLKTKDSTGQIFYLEEIGFQCSSASISGKYSLFDSSKAGGNKKLCGMTLKQETGGGAMSVLDFNDDPMVFSDGTTICISSPTSLINATHLWIKGYTGL